MDSLLSPARYQRPLDLLRMSRVPWNFGGGPVSIRLRSPDHCARLGPTDSANSRSSAVRSVGRCRCPLTRRNCLPASIIPAAHQRNAICPSRPRFRLAACSRHTEIIDSMVLVDRSVRANVVGTPRRSTVSVSDRPSRRLAPAPGGCGRVPSPGRAGRPRLPVRSPHGRRRSSYGLHYLEAVAADDLSRF